jgi:cytochrome c556
MKELDELKKLVDDFVAEANKFIADIKAHEEETKKRVDNIINLLNNERTNLNSTQS